MLVRAGVRARFSLADDLYVCVCVCLSACVCEHVRDAAAQPPHYGRRL